MIEQVRRNNPDKQIMTTSDPGFGKFGAVHSDLPVSDLMHRSLQLFHQSETTRYVTSEIELEATEEAFLINQRIFGELPIQIGCCWGVNSCLNGMEYHKSSELVIAATDLVLMLGRIQDIDHQGRWNSSLTEFLYMAAGEAVELYATTLHLAPCRISQEQFIALIILPKGTNEPLAGGPAGTLWKQNKWMLAHREGPAAGQGAPALITGENRCLAWSVDSGNRA